MGEKDYDKKPARILREMEQKYIAVIGMSYNRALRSNTIYMKIVKRIRVIENVIKLRIHSVHIMT